MFGLNVGIFIGQNNNILYIIMQTYLDLLPHDITNIIDWYVIEIYQREEREKMCEVVSEIRYLWMGALWGAGMPDSTLIPNLYINDIPVYHFLHSKKQQILSIYIRDEGIITFIKPGLYKEIIRRGQVTEDFKKHNYL